MPLSPKSNQRIIAAPDRNKQGQLPKYVDSDKQVSQFNLFDNFTFSTSDSHEGEASAAAYSTNHLKMSNQIPKYGQLKNNWEDDVLPRFSHMNLQSATGFSQTIDPKAPDFIPRNGKWVTPINISQQFIADRGFYQAYENYPYYVIQSQGSYVEPLPMRSVPQFPSNNINNGIPHPSFYVNHWNEYSSNYPNVLNCRTEGCKSYVNPNLRCQETLPAVEFPKKNVAQQLDDDDDNNDELCKAKIKNFKTKCNLLTSAKPVKPIKKIGFSKFPRRRNFTCETQDENDIICMMTTPTPIPKGARPILSARNII
ncbi:uncharacterized protein LOC127286874 [Leptopilina boulardi]|uniref:uncharacterized protein LOC127286874 n=1 Tax=Leptopilina boulardi TaxID=63433 RepID=UPI0021F59516|nr:uncharacterized protein LOC127286874 [Leptopilina boulardi]